MASIDEYNDGENVPDERTNRLFRIQSKVDFDPDKGELRNIMTGEVAPLFTPARRCLLALIENQGEAISQSKLMEIGWGKYNNNISIAAYYQNISNIRRAFSIVMPDQEASNIITTIKRFGIVITKDISVMEMENNEMEDSELASQIVTGTVQKINPATTATYKKRIWPISLAVAIFISLSLTIASWWNTTERNHIFNYTLYTTLPSGCKVFLNDNSGADLAHDPRFNPSTLDCHGYQRAYITRWSQQPRSSLLLCSDDKPGSKGFSCTTYYYASNS